MPYIHSQYLECVLDPPRLRQRVDDAVDALRDIEYDAIVATGCSGLLFGAPLAFVTGKPLIIVRKSSEVRHSPFTVEGQTGTSKYVWVDDFVDSGSTWNRVRTAMREFEIGSVCVGHYLYGGRGFITYVEEIVAGVQDSTVAAD